MELRNQPTGKERWMMRTLERRLEHLENRFEKLPSEEKQKRSAGGDFDLAEITSLRWALHVLRHWTSGFNQRIISKVVQVTTNASSTEEPRQDQEDARKAVN